MSVHAIFWTGKEQHPRNGWNLTACPSEECALQEARSFLSWGHRVHAIAVDGKTILDEEQRRARPVPALLQESDFKPFRRAADR